MNLPCVSFRDVLGSERWSPTLEAIDLLSEVEVILGRDVPTQEVFLIYGRNRLQRLWKDDRDIDVLIIDLARQTDELNQLLALVQMAKDGHDYEESPVGAMGDGSTGRG